MASAQDSEEYVPAVVLRVPFAAGERQQVWRGPGEGSHTDIWNRYAVDFSPLAEGHPILSASAGRVVWVKEDTEGPTGVWADNNEVAVALPGGKEVVVYLHLKKQGAAVSVGDEVLPGDLIGNAGNTGSSNATHLHIDVRKGHRLGPSIPWHFDELGPNEEARGGISILSANVPFRGVLAPWSALDRLVALSRELGEGGAIAESYRNLMSSDHPVLRAASGMREGDEDALLRESWMAMRKRIEEQWLAASQEAGEKMAAAKEGPERVAAALEVSECFPNTESATSAVKFLTGVDALVLRDARRQVATRSRELSPLRAAMTMELKIARDGITVPVPVELYNRLETAYRRATRGWPRERAEIVLRHLRELAGKGD